MGAGRGPHSLPGFEPDAGPLDSRCLARPRPRLSPGYCIRGPAPRGVVCSGQGPDSRCSEAEIVQRQGARSPPRGQLAAVLLHSPALANLGSEDRTATSLRSAAQIGPRRREGFRSSLWLGELSTRRPLRAASGREPSGEAEAPQSRGGEEGGGEGGGEGGKGEQSRGGGGGEGASSAVRSSPGLRHTASPEPPRRPGSRRYRLCRPQSRSSRGKHRRHRRGPPPPRGPGLRLPAPPQPPPEPAREPNRAGLGWAGLGRAQGAGAGARGKTHGRARLSRGAARDCTRTGASPLRAALGLAPGPGG